MGYLRRYFISVIVAFVCGERVSCSDSNSKERVKRRFAALTQPAGTSSGPTRPNLVMSCDINEDGYEQEDALVLNLRFAENSNDFVESIKQQQQEIADQVKEIKKLFKQTRKEQAKLLQIQKGIRDQNAQMTALYSNLLRNKPDSLTASHDIVQESGEADAVPSQRMLRSSQIAASVSNRAANKSMEKDGVVIQSRSFAVQIPSNRSGNSDVAERAAERLVSHVMGAAAELEPENYPKDCQRCGDDEYCTTDESTTRCHPCTLCGPGYEITAPCSRSSDILCEDINECVTGTCGLPEAQCVNTPGGYLCVGGDASCIDDYYFNRRSSQCEPCTTCPSLEHIIVPCSKFSDSVCRTDDVEQLSDVWTGALTKPNKFLKKIRDLGGGFSLPFSDITLHNQTVVEIIKSKRRSRDRTGSSSLRKEKESKMKLLQHGIIWMEYNMAIVHSCRSYIQVSLMISNEDDHATNDGAVLGRTRSRIVHSDSSYRSLVATRLEHTTGDRYKFVSMSAVAEIHPKQNIKVDFRSAHSDCVSKPSKGDRYGLQAIATNSKSGPFSFLWLSHDTGAVAFRATLKSRNVYSNLQAEFNQEYASDLHVLRMSTSGRYFEFKESGIVLGRYHQALYSIGDSCVEQGYSTSCVMEKHEGEEETEALFRSHKSGVTYTDTSVSLTFMTAVEAGDRIALNIDTPTRCQIRYMTDPNLGVANLLWIPRHSGSSLTARLNYRDEINGSVRSRVLTFVETQNIDPSKLSLRSKAYFEFKEAGRVHIHYSTRLVHSCDYVKLALHYTGNAAGSTNSSEIAQQILGDTDGHWDGISIGTSYTVERGSMCHATLTCTRGRVSRMSYGEWSTMSILWIPL